jgi:hypothetical protein
MSNSRNADPWPLTPDPWGLRAIVRVFRPGVSHLSLGAWSAEMWLFRQRWSLAVRFFQLYLKLLTLNVVAGMAGF